MKFAKKFLALCLTACLLCGLPLSLSVSAAGTITLDKAVLLSTTETTVTVQATFSAPIYLQKDRLNAAGKGFVTLRNSHVNGGCSSDSSQHWTWEVNASLVEYVNPTTIGTTKFASTLNITFPRCTCSDHANLWGADGNTLPNPIVLCFYDVYDQTGDGLIELGNAYGVNGENLKATAVTDKADYAYVAVEYKPITLESATLLSTDSDSVRVQANFSAPIYLQTDRLNAAGRGFVTLKNSHANTNGCSSDSSQHWTWEANASLVEYVNPTTSGSRQFASTLNITFPRCTCSDHANLWGADGNTLPNPIVLCFYDLYGTAGDGVIDKGNAYGVNDENLETTNSTDFAYVAVTDNRTLQEKLNTGDGVTLTKNETVDALSIPAGKTLDLNGYTLTADQVISFGGFVVDSKDGVGGIVIAKNGTDDAHLLQLPANNTALPLYDEGFSGYRFFNCTLEHKGRAREGYYQFGYILKMSDAAFALLVDANGDGVIDADIDLNYDITIQVDEKEPHQLLRKFKVEIMEEYAEKQLLDDVNTYAAVLRVTGFDQVTTQVVTLTSTNAHVLSGTGVVIAAANPVSYTYSNAQ